MVDEYQELEHSRQRLPRYVDYASLHLVVAKAVVARSAPLLAEAAATPVNAHGTPELPQAIVLLARWGGSWQPLFFGGMTAFPNACIRGVAADFRELLCPSPWRVLGLRTPSLPRLAVPEVNVGPKGLHGVDWTSIAIPGLVCGAPTPVRLRDGSATVVSMTDPWWDFVNVNTEPPVYGVLAGVRVAVLTTECDNAGGTADGQLAFSAIVYGSSHHRLQVIGIITPRQPFGMAPHVPLLGGFKFAKGSIIVQEGWYGQNDGTCCPRTVATTVWRYANGSLDAVRTTVKRYPTVTTP